MRQAKLLSGSSHPQLAHSIAEKLGMSVSPVALDTYASAETSVEIQVSVRNQDVYVVQTGAAEGIVNDHLMQLLILIHACHHASAKRIVAVIPYFPYSKLSKKKSPRGSITAKLVANMLQVSGVDHVITLDLHAPPIQSFFDIPVDNLLVEPSLSKVIHELGLSIVSYLRNYASLTPFSDREGLYSAVSSSHFAQQQQQQQPLPFHLYLMGGDRQGLPLYVTPASTSRPCSPFYYRPPSSNMPYSGCRTGTPPTYRDDSGFYLPYSCGDQGQLEGRFDGSRVTADGDLEALFHSDMVIVAKNVGVTKRVTSLADRLDVDFAVLHPARPEEEVEEDENKEQYSLRLVGNVNGKIAWILDDIIDDPSSYLRAASVVRSHGASFVAIIAIHSLLRSESLTLLESDPNIDLILLTNSVPLPGEQQVEGGLVRWKKVRILDVTPILSEAMRRIHNGESISSLFYKNL